MFSLIFVVLKVVKTLCFLPNKSEFRASNEMLIHFLHDVFWMTSHFSQSDISCRMFADDCLLVVMLCLIKLQKDDVVPQTNNDRETDEDACCTMQGVKLCGMEKGVQKHVISPTG